MTFGLDNNDGKLKITQNASSPTNTSYRSNFSKIVQIMSYWYSNWSLWNKELIAISHFFIGPFSEELKVKRSNFQTLFKLCYVCNVKVVQLVKIIVSEAWTGKQICHRWHCLEIYRWEVKGQDQTAWRRHGTARFWSEFSSSCYFTCYS